MLCTLSLSEQYKVFNTLCIAHFLRPNVVVDCLIKTKAHR